ncbi:MAG: hydrogenase maturation protease [Desulfobaccales bacterium]
MHIRPKTLIKVIGVGNAWRGDDAAGLMIAQRLRKENFAYAEIAESPGTGTTLADAWQGAPRVIVVDAVVAGGPPGAIYRFDAHDPAATFPVASPASSHGWGVAEAVALGRLFQELPPVLIIYGIEGQNFALGDGLSPAVAAAIPEAARRIAQEIQAWGERQTGKAKQPSCHIPERQNNGT